MSVIAIPTDYGLYRDAAVAATTVRMYLLPPACREVEVVVEVGGSAVEVSFEGTDGAASSNADYRLVYATGGGVVFQVPPTTHAAALASRKMYLRPQASTSTNIVIQTWRYE